MAFALQGWAAQVSGLLERLEVISDRVVASPAIISSLAPMGPPPPWCDHEESLLPAVACGKDISDAGVAGCSSEVLATVALPVDIPPPLDLALHRMVTQGEEAQAKVAEKVRGTDDMERTEVSLPVGLVGEVTPLVSSPGMTASEGNTHMMSSGSEELLGDTGVPSTTLLDELLSSFSCTAPQSLLVEPIQLQIEGVSTCSGRRSDRLDKKNKNCNIPIAKRAEYRLAEAYGELPKGMTSKKATEEEVQEKMKPYLQMYKKPPTPMAVQAIRALVEVNV
uniref:Uncharacterized protein n=1 Tax=Triticum aestivum TaxID=4565 RepID=A0A3B6UAA8_WHEAT